ncbi:MAG: hypothetical protein A3K19_08310 [Lentisphaerae bacterium RIFOXYB12_FULL_65_16]|nr:MAG: hypothetical protein A3K18_00310 [Lentisphaerae bacterium RIFOXYA12_64_32]OGV89872.1 MAG: hypothetical protein A3K19_08310 [Lentisphaerae bacterium RIFOXYB12_FULL_65_16]
MPYSPADVSRLLDEARAGSVDAFAELFEQYRPMVSRAAYRLVGPNDCDDVAMETYLKAWRALPGFRRQSSISTWLCQIARNCALDFYRQRSRRDARHVSQDDPDGAPLIQRVADPHAQAPDRAAEVHDLGAAINEAVAQLSEEHRTALLLREVDGLSYRDVAAATGVTVGTVMSRLFYARRKLRTMLEASGPWQN